MYVYNMDNFVLLRLLDFIILPSIARKARKAALVPISAF